MGLFINPSYSTVSFGIVWKGTLLCALFLINSAVNTRYLRWKRQVMLCVVFSQFSQELVLSRVCCDQPPIIWSYYCIELCNKRHMAPAYISHSCHNTTRTNTWAVTFRRLTLSLHQEAIHDRCSGIVPPQSLLARHVTYSCAMRHRSNWSILARCRCHD
jgi:hypothetical protein